MRTTFLLALSIATGLGTAGVVSAQPAPGALRGSWRPTTYILKDGARHPLDGLIFFTATDWTVLYFVLDGRGKPARGSGEGGTYTVTGNRLTFAHRYNFASGTAMEGLPETPLTMTARPSAGAPTEPSTIAISGSRLTIDFPSGNRIEFVKSSEP